MIDRAIIRLEQPNSSPRTSPNNLVAIVMFVCRDRALVRALWCSILMIFQLGDLDMDQIMSLFRSESRLSSYCRGNQSISIPISLSNFTLKMSPFGLISSRPCLQLVCLRPNLAYGAKARHLIQSLYSRLLRHSTRMCSHQISSRNPSAVTLSTLLILKILQALVTSLTAVAAAPAAAFTFPQHTLQYGHNCS